MGKLKDTREAYEAASLESFVIGDRIGSGLFRDVHVWRPNEKYVVKIATGAVKHNILEFETWHEAAYSPEFSENWLAPCISLSPCGTYLLQMRTSPIGQAELPDRVPAILTDLKRSNFGRLGDNIVCHDYGFMIHNYSAKKMKKAYWDE